MCVETVGRVLQVDEMRGDVLLDTSMGIRRASLALLLMDGQRVEPGEWLVAHTGFVTTRVDETNALQMIAEQAAMRGLSPGMEA